MQDVCFKQYKYLHMKRENNTQMEASPKFKRTNNMFELFITDRKASLTINSEAEDVFKYI